MYILLGALNKETKQYESPSNATKSNKYMCPDCNRDVILKKGSVRKHHFAHYKDDDPCMYYTHPSESQIHKDAKLLLKSLLDNETPFTIRRCCNKCNTDIFCKEFIYIKKCTNMSVIEYRFIYNNISKIADIGYLENMELKYIFEICHKHKTREEDRPEPWYEIDATELLQTYSSGIIKCIRKQLCDNCLENNNKIRRPNDIFLKLHIMATEIKEKPRIHEICIERNLEKRYNELKTKYLNYNPIINRGPINDKHEYYEYNLLKERFETCKLVEDP